MSSRDHRGDLECGRDRHPPPGPATGGVGVLGPEVVVTRRGRRGKCRGRRGRPPAGPRCRYRRTPPRCAAVSGRRRRGRGGVEQPVGVVLGPYVELVEHLLELDHRPDRRALGDAGGACLGLGRFRGGTGARQPVLERVELLDPSPRRSPARRVRGRAPWRRGVRSSFAHRRAPQVGEESRRRRRDGHVAGGRRSRGSPGPPPPASARSWSISRWVSRNIDSITRCIPSAARARRSRASASAISARRRPRSVAAAARKSSTVARAYADTCRRSSATTRSRRSNPSPGYKP